MKTKITLFYILLSMSFAVKSQTYVTIPDANFVAWLQANVPSAMNGNQMDTSSIAVTTRTSIYVVHKGIADLTGIQYFDSLKTLDCSSTNSGTAYSNTFTNLPHLPVSLDTLLCHDNLLTSLPALPISIQYLGCHSNNLTSLPSLPNSLQYLDCSGNNLISLPALPNSLQYLDCILDQLTSLPTLPNSLQFLYCHHNQLTSLPALPNTLVWLICYKNQLTGLPPLPNSLHFINCSDNLLTGLPNLPDSLQALLCYNNNIMCFPLFPNTIINPMYFAIGNSFTCLPNYIPVMLPDLLAFPLCVSGDTINNVNGCTGSDGITGFAYKNNNSNCILDTGDLSLVNIPLKLYDNSNNLLSQTYSGMNGIYDLHDSIATYTVKLDTMGMPFIAQCDYPGMDSIVTLTIANPLINNVNFDIACKPGFDVGVQSIVTNGQIFPNAQHRIRIVAGDQSHWYNLNCISGIGGQIQVTVTGPVTFTGVGSGALTPSITGNVFTYAIADFGTINNSQAFGLLFSTDTSAQAGDQICVNVSITPTIGDNNPSNNNYQFCYQVVNSYDPNMKEVYPVDVLPGYQDYFTYTIHFQNTGTASAANIRLEDTLNTNLDLETFKVINYSHYNTVSLNGNLLTFRFPNIQLPDSSSNPEGSKGFIQYRIKPKANLIAGTQIQNTAHIYFDYNAPIHTNATVNTFTTSIGIQNLSNTNNAVLISPNPFTFQTNITFDKEQKNTTIKIIDILGKELKTINFTGKKLIIDKGNLPKGIYFLQVIDSERNVLNKKIMIQ